MSLRILITGANGQLGSEFKRVLDKIGIHFIVQSKKELDFTDLIKLFEIAKTFKPTHVINCTAYNLVDKAESEALNAYRVNTIGVANLSLVCREINAYLIHYSTDYIFDGKKEAPYTEEDTPNPLNEYGKSKLTGEILLKEVWREKSLIFRTSWVYGNGKQNFIYKLNQWAQSQDHLRIACDEFSVPTSTRTIVEVTLKAIDVGLTGLYHLVNSGYASIYEWAKKYFKIKGIDKFIYPAYQSDFNLPAKRPRWSVMSNDKIKKKILVLR